MAILISLSPTGAFIRNRVHVNDARELAEHWRSQGIDVSVAAEPDEPPSVDELLEGLVRS